MYLYEVNTSIYLYIHTFVRTYSYIWPDLGSCSILARFATGFDHMAHDLVTKMGVHHVQPIAVIFFGGGVDV